jgi:ATP-binding cassette, subfamily B, bacterial PglK
MSHVKVTSDLSDALVCNYAKPQKIEKLSMKAPNLLSTFKSAFSLLRKIDQIKIFCVLLIEIFLGFLDLLGVICIGALGALAIQGLESQTAGNKVSKFLNIIGIQDYPFQQQIQILGLLAGLFLVTKTVASLLLTRKIYFFLSHKTAEVSAKLVRKILSQNLVELQRKTSQQNLYIVTEGVKSLLVGVLAAGITIASDLVLMLVVISGLLILDPILAIFTTALFLLIGYVLYLLLNRRAHYLGVELNNLSVIGNQKILEAINSYRELIVRNRRQFYSDRIKENRVALGRITAESNFQPYISKYVIELVSVVGLLAVGSYLFSTKNTVYAVSVLVVFLTATSRIAPSALRIQQGVLAVKNSAGSAETTLKLIKELEDIEISFTHDGENSFIYDTFTPDLEIISLSFKYPASRNFALKNINLKISQGTSVAVVGPSGAGKTTLVDIILGVIEPTLGEVLISGMKPMEASRKWSGAIAYVPQNIVVASGTIRDNVGLGYGKEKFDNDLVWSALEIAELSTMISNLPMNLDTDIGENGSKLSGGERQRLGIARALFTKPKILVLDEATSSLDGETEASITNALEKFSGKVTRIIIAHRLSTIKNVDQVIYLENGSIQAIGTFEEIREKIPNFEKQAKLMGL